MMHEGFFQERSSRVILPAQGTVEFSDGWYRLTSEGGSSYASTTPGTINPLVNRMVICRDETIRVHVPENSRLYVAAGLGAILTVTRVIPPTKTKV